MAEHDTSRSDPTDSVTGDGAIGARRAGAAASRSELRFRTLFERAGVGMAEIDPQWRIVSANAAYCRIAGRDNDELLGESCLAFTAPEDIEKSKSALGGLVGAGPDSVSFEKRYLRPDKSVVWIRSNLARIEQPDGSNRFLKIVEDITEAKAAEAALAEAQEALRVRGEQFHTLADNIPVLAWMAYADGHIFWYNRRWYDYTGTSPKPRRAGGGKRCTTRMSCRRSSRGGLARSPPVSRSK